MGRMTSLKLVLATVGTAMALAAQAAPSMTLTVRFAPSLKAESVHAILAVTGVTVVSHPQADTYKVTGPRRARAEQLATLFAAIPGVAATDPVPPHHPEDQYQPMVVQDQALLPGTLTLTPQAGATLNQEQLAKALGASRVEIDPATGTARIQLPAQADLAMARQLAAGQPGVAQVDGGRPYPLPSPAAAHLGAGGRVLGAIPLAGPDVQVQFHPWAGEQAQQRFQSVFQANTVRRLSRSVLVVRPQGLTAAAAARAFRLVPAVRAAAPHHGS
jgi:hypothetical protein